MAAPGSAFLAVKVQRNTDTPGMGVLKTGTAPCEHTAASAEVVRIDVKNPPSSQWKSRRYISCTFKSSSRRYTLGPGVQICTCKCKCK